MFHVSHQETKLQFCHVDAAGVLWREQWSPAVQGRDEQTKFLIPKSKFNLVPGSILSYNKLLFILFYFSNQRRWETGSFKYVG